MKLIIGAQVVSVITAQSCQSNSECIKSAGAGACCLVYNDDARCRDKMFVNYYLQSHSYDPLSKTWTSPDDPANSATVYCKEDQTWHKGMYPYPQPYDPPGI